MRRLMIWISPLIGVVIGMTFLLLAHYQSPVEARHVEVATATTQQDRQERAGGAQADAQPFVWPSLELDGPNRANFFDATTMKVEAGSTVPGITPSREDLAPARNEETKQ